MISPKDILYLFSGGSSNSNQEKSLGGSVSSYQVPGSVNNLFPNIDESQQSTGILDYKCFYVFNNSLVNIFDNVNIYIENNLSILPILTLGVKKTNSIQEIVITGSITGGFIILGISNLQTYKISYSGSPISYGAEIENALNNLLENISVVVLTTFTSNIQKHQITFVGPFGFRAQDSIVVIQNSLISSGQSIPQIQSNYISIGSPVNTQAGNVLSTYNAPEGVTFFDTNKDVSVEIGTLLPGDYFPVWIRRNVPAGTPPIVSAMGEFKVDVFARPTTTSTSSSTTSSTSTSSTSSTSTTSTSSTSSTTSTTTTSSPVGCVYMINSINFNFSADIANNGYNYSNVTFNSGSAPAAIAWKALSTGY